MCFEQRPPTNLANKNGCRFKRYVCWIFEILKLVIDLDMGVYYNIIIWEEQQQQQEEVCDGLPLLIWCLT